MVDVNQDGKIQYEGMVPDWLAVVFCWQPDHTDTSSAEFRTFVTAAEKQLELLFRSIDRNHDGHLGRDELQAAFQKASLTVPKRRVAGFFDEIDMNNDGFITFDEWR